MKYSAAAVAALVAVASAQDISIIPSCALPCIDSAVTSSTSCSTTDYPCICENVNSLVAAATACVIAACGSDVAINEVLPATTTFCQEVAAGAGSSSSSVAVSTSAGSTSVASTSAASSSVAVTSSTPVSTSSAASTTVSTSTTKTNSSTTSSTTQATVTAGAAIAGSIGSVAMLVLGAFAAF